jgi:hypothetical protein
MDVRVVEPGKYQPATRVDDFGPRTAQRANPVVGADGGDTLALDRDGGRRTSIRARAAVRIRIRRRRAFFGCAEDPSVEDEEVRYQRRVRSRRTRS